MQIYGRNVGLLFSVGAKYKIGQLEGDNFTRTVKTAVILSEAYEAAEKFKDPAYVGQPLTEDEVLSLPDSEFTTLCEEINAAFTVGNKVSVEAESKKKEAASS